MESIVRTVGEIEAAERQVYETVLGRRLDETQQVVLRVLAPGVVPSEAIRNEALGGAAEIARQGRENAAAQGASEAELDAAIDEAIAHVRARSAS